MLPATLVTIASFLLKFCSSSPVYSMQPAYIIANIGTTGRNIRNLPCISRKTNEKGVCMFAIDCLKANGTHLGTCIDRFYFGSCCHIPPMHDIVGNTIDTAIIPARQPPSRLSSTTEKLSSSGATATTGKTTSTPQITTTTSKTTATPKLTQRPNITVAVTTTTQKIPSPTSGKPFPSPSPSFGEKLSTKKTSFTTTKSSSYATAKPTSSSTLSPQANVAETTEVSYKLTTFQTVEENTVNGEITTSTKFPKLTTIRIQSTQTPKSTITTTKSTTSRPVPNSPKPKPPSTPFRPRPTHQKPTIRPRPPPTTSKPLRISKPTFKPLPISTRTPTKPTKSTSKPGKITTKKPVISAAKLTTTSKPPRATITRVTKKPIATTTVITTLKPSITTLITTSKPSTTEKVTSSQIPVIEKFTLLTELTTGPTISSVRPSPTKISTTKSPLSSSRAPSTTTEKVTITVPTIVPSTTTTTANVSTTQSNDVPVVSSELEAVNGNPATNEIEQPKPLQPPPTTEETNSPSLVTWALVNEETTSKLVTTISPEWMPITTPDGWVLLPSLSTELPGVTATTSAALNNTKYNETTSEKPLETTSATTTTAPFNYSTENSSTVSSSTTISTASTLPLVSSTIANLIDASSTTETSVNMSDFTDVCGRRMYPEARIVGGERATFGEWPWQISLRQWRTSTYLHKCGAALLNENWAITAAHCVDNVPPSDLLLRLGEHDLSTDNEPYIHQERRVQIVASHPQFDPRTFEYDLALLRFYEPVQFQPNIIPVCVPSSDDNFVGRNAYVTGWGRLYEDGPLPSVLQKVSVPVINNTVCETMYRSAGYIEHIPHIFICAGWRRGGFDSCEGDSGGPMVIQRPDKRFLLAGVISWGIGCAEPNQPGVYTRISEFRDWINQILQF